MKQKRIFCALLSSLIFAASCGSQGSAPGGDTTSTGDTTTAETTKPGIISKLTPELKEELGLDGYEFNVFLRGEGTTWSLKDVVSDGENGDVLNDAVFKRNIWLEDNYGFKLTVGYSADASSSELTTYILAGDDSYDAFFPMGRTAGAAASQGLLQNLKELNYIDLENDCWNHMFSDALEIDGKLFYATGAITTISYDAVRLFMFNKTLLGKYMLEDPYTLVREGKWTFDKMNEMASKVSADLNGDSQMTAEDQYGLGWQSSVGAQPFIFGAGEKVSKMDKDGLPRFNLDSERFADIYTKIRDTIANHDVYYSGADEDVLKMFYEERSLFFTEVLNCAKKLRPYEVDFGLLPLAKWDEDQEEYIQYVDAWCLSPVVVAKNNTNPDRTGFIIQALAEASKDYLVQPYYETVLNGKVLRDEESSEMLDIVVNNFVLDNCDIYQWGGILTVLRDGIANGSDLSSIIAANKAPIETAIEKTIENIRG